MSPRIPEEKIEEIRKSVDIVDIISEYVQLKKQGRNLTGLCPFHGEKTPSFSVSPDKQLYHCFGCGAGGNVFSFLMETDGLSFSESVAKIARRVNISVPEAEEAAGNSGIKDETFQPWIEGHSLAAKLYHHILTATDEGRDAREYLRKRGFTREAIDTFQIGYAPDSWDLLTNFLEKRNFSLKDMAESGLLAVRDFDKKSFDRFRDRIMFPIWNKNGEAVAFGGRILGEGNPKYLNSPESALFKKSEILYNFHQARKAIKKKGEAVLFEGYVDVISAWRAGIHHGVAALGTALTENHARMLRRNADKVIICYDGDDAGQNATFKNAVLLEESGLQVRVARLPEGYDPDDYIQQNGPEQFSSQVISQSMTLMAFKFQYFRRGRNLLDEGERMDYIHTVLKEISLLERAVERDHYIRQLAEEFNISLEALKQEQHQIFKSQKKKEKREIRSAAGTYAMKPQKKLKLAHENAERLLLAHMLHSDSVAVQVQDQVGGTFNIDEYQAIAAHLYSFYGEGHSPDPSLFIERMEDEKLKRITTELAMMTINTEMSEQELDDYIRQIKKYPKRLEIEQLKTARKEAEEAGDFNKAASIAMDIIKMEQALKKI
ncbi:DNA primase [Evansella sp. LMS18]|uniref:DNA primase n=1 Tax=Evansella sp. LMS18 TaxID=2924033 RepID=UPI0020D1E1E7|nr:DNA primase [Evansella sp. LMS18]UTR09371.1 DNA primase [Evansella sp. LMS18]